MATFMLLSLGGIFAGAFGTIAIISFMDFS
jgi:hypothetical protein